MAKQDHHGVSEQSKASLHRRADAQGLFDGKRWRGCMYVAGYSVECLLKAQLMRKFGCDTLRRLEKELADRGMLPGDRSVYTHQLVSLLELTGGADRMRRDEPTWRSFSLVNKWMPAWRYTADLADEDYAGEFLAAVDRVLQWVRNNV